MAIVQTDQGPKILSASMSELRFQGKIFTRRGGDNKYTYEAKVTGYGKIDPDWVEKWFTPQERALISRFEAEESTTVRSREPGDFEGKMYGDEVPYTTLAFSIWVDWYRIEVRKTHVFGRDDFLIEDGVLVGYYDGKGASGFASEFPEEIVIPEGVTAIGSHAFSDRRAAIRLSIPDGVKRIGGWAFSGCSKLENITVPQSVTEIGPCAFANCKGLKRVCIEGNIEKIGVHTFAFCTELSSVELPDSVTRIASGAFRNCTALREIIACSRVKELVLRALTPEAQPSGRREVDGGFVIRYCWPLYRHSHVDEHDNILEKYTGTAEHVVIPEDVTHIGKEAFQNCESLRSVVIPDTVVKIGEAAFRGCAALERVRLSNSLVWFGRYIFEDCRSLTQIVLPRSVHAVTDGMFKNCVSLVSVRMSKGVCARENGFELAWRGGINWIGEEAFYGCKSLRRIAIPASTQGIDSNAFNGCAALKHVRFEGEKIYLHDRKTVSKWPGRIFEGCSALRRIALPPKCREIPPYTFYGCTALEHVTLPEELEEIRVLAFCGCSALRRIAIPPKTKKIAGNAFKDCTHLWNVVLMSRNTAVYSVKTWRKIPLCAEAFEGAKHLTVTYRLKQPGEAKRPDRAQARNETKSEPSENSAKPAGAVSAAQAPASDHAAASVANSQNAKNAAHAPVNGGKAAGTSAHAESEPDSGSVLRGLVKAIVKPLIEFLLLIFILGLISEMLGIRK